MRRIYLSMLLALLTVVLMANTTSISSIEDFKIEVIKSDNESTMLELHLGSFEQYELDIEGKTYQQIRLSDQGFLMEEGSPELPYISKSLIIPDQSKMEVSFVGGEFLDLTLDVAPSKGIVYRNINPNQIPYSFSEQYQTDELFPGILVDSDDPYIFRDFRGLTAKIYPFQYNPVEGKLRVYKRMLIEVKEVGVDTVNVLNRNRSNYSIEFKQIYRDHFINFTEQRYELIPESGRMIVICYDEFIEAITPYVEWKNQKGLPTELIRLSSIGNTYLQIKAFIQTQYNLNDGLTFVQLVGDAAQIATTYVRNGGSDPSYALLDGDDYYPEIFVGRFSAENVAQVKTQVERTIHYERDIDEDADWFRSAIGIASNEGEHPSDIEHMNKIRNDLLDYNYDHVDGFYQPSATATQVRNAVNAGRGMINYVGHGLTTLWVTTGFGNSHVNSLKNELKLPFIVSVACLNGNFTASTCFAEAWLRAKNSSNDNPTGAIAMYASSVSQAWIQPMTAQNEIIDLLTKEKVNTIGGLMYNGSSKMIDQWGGSGGQEFLNWHIFGDASLQVRTDTPQQMLVDHPEVLFFDEKSLLVQTDTPNALVSLSDGRSIIGSGYTNSNGIIELPINNPPDMPQILLLTVTAFNKVTYVGSIPYSVNEGAYLTFYDFRFNDKLVNEYLNFNFDETVNIAFNLRNVGVDKAVGIKAALVSDDPLLIIKEPAFEVGDLQPDEVLSLEEAFQIEFAQGIEDGQTLLFSLNFVDNEENIWEKSFQFRINAPILKTSALTIDDSSGNNNKMIDPGETVIVYLPIKNDGHAITPQTSVSLFTFDPNNEVISSSVQEIGVIHPYGITNARFILKIGEEVKPNTILSLGAVITSGGYSLQKTYNTYISNALGHKVEDFSSGDFKSNNWRFTGTRDWEIETDLAHQGAYSARSGKITHNQTSSMYIELRIVDSGEISFFRRTSTEAYGDYLMFFINDVKMGEWSGGGNWSKVSFPVDPGTHTFRWTYAKNESISSGIDAVWIDLIEFPPITSITTKPIIYTDIDRLEFGTLSSGESATQAFLLRNFGDSTLEGVITLPDGYFFDNASERTEYTYSLNPNESEEIRITFAPTETKSYDGELVFSTNSIYQPELRIELFGQGLCSSADDILLPTLTTELGENYPNPFNPSTTISFSLQEREHVEITVYNVLGQRVKTLCSEVKEPGRYSLTWDGLNDNSISTASGIYFYKMKTSSYLNIKKMMLIK